MCVDAYDNFTTNRIGVGYASPELGHCVREMVMKDIVGEPVDAPVPMFNNTSVERHNGRTIVRFTVSQHWPVVNASLLQDGPFRVMWAIGKVSGHAGCQATIGFHGINRGVAPIRWLGSTVPPTATGCPDCSLGSSSCTYSEFEMGNIAI